ncbi:MAG: hypothetical protein H8E73_06710 [Planctomycetes bacterium]|nr:hypothetical protein [Planctomycetota bacterium]
MSDVTRILSAIEQGDTPHNRLAARPASTWIIPNPSRRDGAAQMSQAARK